MSDQPDEVILSALAATGAPGPLDTLLDRHWGQSYRIALRALNDADAAAALVHEVFSHLALGVPALNEGATFRGWLHARLYQRLGLHERRGSAGPSTAGPVRPGAPEEPLSTDELRRHLCGVPLDARLALILHLYEGCPMQEVGDALDCTASVARTRVQEGQRSLQELLTEAGHGSQGPAEIAELMREAPNPIAPAAPLAAALVDSPSAAGSGRALGLLVVGIAFAALVIGGALSVLTGDDSAEDWAQTGSPPVIVPSAVPTATGTAQPGASGAEVQPSDPGLETSPRETPAPVADAVQCWLRHEGGQAAGDYVVYLQHRDALGSRPLSRRSDASGLVTLALKPGTYLVAVHADPTADVIAEVVIGPGTLALEVVVPSRHVVRGLLTDSTGRPLAGGAVWVSVEGSRAAVETGLDGRFELPEQPAGRLGLGARADGFRELDQEPFDHDGTEIRLVLAEGRSLLVTGRLAPDVAVSGELSFLLRAPDGSIIRMGTAPASQGSFQIELEDLPPATTLSLGLSAGKLSAAAAFTLGSDQVQAELGEVSFPESRVVRGQVVLPPGYEIDSGQGVVLDGLFEPEGAVQPDGNFEVRGVSAASSELELVVRAKGKAWGPILHRRLALDVATIEGGDLGHVELLVVQLDALRPKDQRNLHLRRAELTPDDLVIEVVGAPASTAEDLLEALTKESLAGRSVQVIASRGGQRREVSLDLSGLTEPLVHGLFEPARQTGE